MGGQTSSPSFLHLLLILLLTAMMAQLWAFPFRASLDLDITPRTTVFSKGEAHIATMLLQTKGLCKIVPY